MNIADPDSMITVPYKLVLVVEQDHQSCIKSDVFSLRIERFLHIFSTISSTSYVILLM